ncbi:PilZ domain-containing protein [Parablastomonas sp. CN1-191]|uniref:PilZ domain-containing protein n=1 Tax=Parablastomonas sp. CN1-191 TaxID=3400908 RepID=UPI003BF7F5FD
MNARSTFADFSAAPDRVEASQRRGSRDSVFIAAQVRALGREQAVRLRNLSEDGAMIEGQINLVPGQRITVNVRNKGWVDGQVAWVRPNRCGIIFAAPIDPRQARTPV